MYFMLFTLTKSSLPPVEFHRFFRIRYFQKLAKAINRTRRKNALHNQCRGIFLGHWYDCIDNTMNLSTVLYLHNECNLVYLQSRIIFVIVTGRLKEYEKHYENKYMEMFT